MFKATIHSRITLLRHSPIMVTAILYQSTPKLLQQHDPSSLAGIAGRLVPDAALHLANVGHAHHQHAQPRLADAAADRERQLTVQQHAVKRQRAPVVATGEGQLPVQGFFIHPDAH